MVTGVLADVNIEGHVTRLLQLLQQAWRQEFWEYMALQTPTFAEVGLEDRAPDDLVWRCCQERQLVLVTANRNADGETSLELTVRQFNTLQSLPVITLADPRRFLRDQEYADRAADSLLEYLLEIERYRGAGRLYVP